MVGADAGDHYTVDRVADAGGVLIEVDWASDAVVLRAAALQQRAAECGFEVGCPVARQAAEAELRGRVEHGDVVALVVRVIAEGEGGAVGRGFGDAGREGAEVLREDDR